MNSSAPTMPGVACVCRENPAERRRQALEEIRHRLEAMGVAPALAEAVCAHHEYLEDVFELHELLVARLLREPYELASGEAIYAIDPSQWKESVESRSRHTRFVFLGDRDNLITLRGDSRHSTGLHGRFLCERDGKCEIEPCAEMSVSSYRWRICAGLWSRWPSFMSFRGYANRLYRWDIRAPEWLEKLWTAALAVGGL